MKRAMTTMFLTLASGGYEAAAGQPGESRIPVRTDFRICQPVSFEGPVLAQAQAQASWLLKPVGIRLDWYAGKPKERESGDRVIGLTFIPMTSEAFRSTEKANTLASALPYAQGATSITVFGDRLEAYLESFKKADRAKILGHVLAMRSVTCWKASRGIRRPG